MILSILRNAFLPLLKKLTIVMQDVFNQKLVIPHKSKLINLRLQLLQLPKQLLHCILIQMIVKLQLAQQFPHRTYLRQIKLLVCQ